MSGQIRQRFFEFFESKNHRLVSSAPIVNKDDPSLMFTNAGMNQFKDYFLGTKKIVDARIVNTQKCLRVSGKHNDLEEVGVDGYHHTMFEMLGNWSFGDYFKEEIIDWAFELLTEVYELPEDRLYASVFGGDEGDGLSRDDEAAELWRKYLPESHILDGTKEDNFWEMGDTGPCGPCSEIHIDLRPEEEVRKLPGRELVNKDHPLVVELWNLVFIQFNRLASGELENLSQNHVDTGMGLERLCMAIQGKTSNYETDLFTVIIDEIGSITRKKYGNQYTEEAKSDIAFRVVADHIRAVAFTIADGQMPSNTGAGYVIRRILRRAVRYYYTFLKWEKPLLYKLVDVLANQMEAVFPELKEQQEFIEKVILEEEKSFLRTLADGIQRFHLLEAKEGVISGRDAFILYDTYGFPIDLTELMAREQGWTIDIPGFEEALEEQKSRSRQDASQKVGDWTILSEEEGSRFEGYDHSVVEEAHIVRMRTVERRDKKIHQIVLNRTPFYAEGGGQVGDTGRLITAGGEEIRVLDTRKDNELIIHVVDRLPENPKSSVKALIDVDRQKRISKNHSATHLLHAALAEVLGDHVQQRGSLVAEEYLRFDFSHYERLTPEQLQRVEDRVNEMIEADIACKEDRNISIAAAKEAGAKMFFGEKYGETVRMITFDPAFSRELCGGIHVARTGLIRLFKIVSESSVAAGVRRIEARTGEAAIAYLDEQVEELNQIKSLFKSPVKVKTQIENLMKEIENLEAVTKQYEVEKKQELKKELVAAAEQKDNYRILAHTLQGSGGDLKTLVHELGNELTPGIIILGNQEADKAQLFVYIDRSLTGEYDLNAGTLIREVAGQIKGGGGGQPFFASAGGKSPEGVPGAVSALKSKIEEKIVSEIA